MKNQFKINTQVQIINPEFLVRCGYNETLESATEKLKKEFKDEYEMSIEDMLYDHFDFLYDDKNENINTVNSIISKLARVYNRTVLNFGGKERKVFTERKEEYLNKKVFIISDAKKIHKSGYYVPSNGGSGSYLYDYEPPYLENIKTHVFYNINEVPLSPDLAFNVFNVLNDLWIERKNIRIINE